jgi:DNA polymerase-3 subunit gamma/tau
VQPTEQQKVVAHPVYKEYPQTISLQSVVNEKARLEDGQLSFASEDFTQEQFATVWKNFVKSESTRRPRLSALLNSQIPQKPENGLQFRFIVDSQTVKEYLYKNLHSALEGYLRENLHNSNIVLRFEMDGDTETEVRNDGLPYTAKEKYVYLLEKNPELKLLRDTFDLETD